MITMADFLPDVNERLRFYADIHVYGLTSAAHTAGERPLPSVTHILKATGISRDWSDIPLHVLNQKREIGRAAHLAAHYYDDGALVAGSVDPRVRPYLDAWIEFREVTGFTPALLETPLYHPTLFVAGTIDRAGHFANFAGADARDLLTVDIKCGDEDDAGADWQTAAYANLLHACLAPSSPWHEPLGLATRPRYSVQLLPTGHYKLHRYEHTLLRWNQFQQFVTTYRLQHARRAEVVRV